MKQKKMLLFGLLFGLFAVGVMFSMRQKSYTQEKSPADKINTVPADTPEKCPTKENNAVVVVRNTNEPGGFEVENKGEAVDLDWQVMIERKEKGEWRRLSKEDKKSFLYVLLAEQCPTINWMTGNDKDKPSCKHLAKGEIIHPKPWTGYSCSAQCWFSCRANAPIYGTFRFVVRSCDQQKEFYGAEFEGRAWKTLSW